jgi:sulfite exporter TauE/SafE
MASIITRKTSFQPNRDPQMPGELIIPALLMGLAGSLHCVGMCGPIAMAMPLQGREPWRKISGGLMYNAGRITTYAAFGLLAGWLGAGLRWFGWQQRVSLILGITILVFMIAPAIARTDMLQRGMQSRMVRIRQVLAKVLFRGTPSAMFATGLLNGLLPCGLTYMALAGSAVSGSPLQGAGFMALFGMGTAPVMLATVWMGSILHHQVRYKLRKMYPALLIIMSILLIIRGLDLGIPYVSPRLKASINQAAHCRPN